MTKLKQDIQNHLDQINIELYHLEWDREFGVKVLRIMVDNQKQIINMEEIIKISKHISTYLDENDPTNDNYNLEVLSAGIERELYTQKHWDKSVEKIVFVVLKKPIKNVKRLFAKVLEVLPDKIVLETHDETKNIYTLKLNEIKKANWAYQENKDVR